MTQHELNVASCLPQDPRLEARLPLSIGAGRMCPAFVRDVALTFRAPRQLSVTPAEALETGKTAPMNAHRIPRRLRLRIQLHDFVLACRRTYAGQARARIGRDTHHPRPHFLVETTLAIVARDVCYRPLSSSARLPMFVRPGETEGGKQPLT